MEQGWRSYDSAAAVHDRIAVPHVFAPPAKDLVAALAFPTGGLGLDVGTGTGVAALLALESAGPGSVVVGLDPSLDMLRVARRKGLPWLVRGGVPGLPHSDGAFDRVMANFVLNHVTSYDTALSDMVRVLRPGAGWASQRGDLCRTSSGVRGRPRSIRSSARRPLRKSSGRRSHGMNGSQMPPTCSKPFATPASAASISSAASTRPSC